MERYFLLSTVINKFTAHNRTVYYTHSVKVTKILFIFRYIDLVLVRWKSRNNKFPYQLTTFPFPYISYVGLSVL